MSNKDMTIENTSIADFAKYLVDKYAPVDFYYLTAEYTEDLEEKLEEMYRHLEKLPLKERMDEPYVERMIKIMYFLAAECDDKEDDVEKDIDGFFNPLMPPPLTEEEAYKMHKVFAEGGDLTNPFIQLSKQIAEKYEKKHGIQ